MALQISSLPRIFKFKHKNSVIMLDDPNPKFTASAVLNFYSNTYPELTTASIQGPVFESDSILYEFCSVMGTKG